MTATTREPWQETWQAIPGDQRHPWIGQEIELHEAVELPGDDLRIDPTGEKVRVTGEFSETTIGTSSDQFLAFRRQNGTAGSGCLTNAHGSLPGPSTCRLVDVERHPSYRYSRYGLPKLLARAARFGILTRS